MVKINIYSDVVMSLCLHDECNNRISIESFYTCALAG